MSFEEIDLQWFAAEDEGRTEEPTESKIRKAREEGRVAKSQELCSAAVLFVTVIMLVFLAPHLFRWFSEVLIYYFNLCMEGNILQKRFFNAFAVCMLKMVLPIAGAGVITGIIINIVQNRGFIFSTKPIEPQFSKIAPRIGQYLKKTVFSAEGGFNVVKNLFKVAAVGVVAFVIVFLPVINAFFHDSGHIEFTIQKFAWTTAKILIISAIIFILISIPDYIVQKRQFIESLKMTKQEVKQEYKEMEGDPEVKGHLQQAQREMLQRNMPAQVRKSDVVITNPTHFAVALLYDSTKADAPQVMAKGADQVAFRIRSIATEGNIPIVENRPLARSLYAETEVGDIIPSTYFAAIATIYSHIDKFKKQE